MLINVIGLGYLDKDVTLNGYKIIKSGIPLYLRSDKLKCAAFLKKEKIAYCSFDDVYENSEDFENTYREIAERLQAAAMSSEIAYLTDGSGVRDGVLKYITGDVKVYPSCEKGAERIVGTNSFVRISAYDLISKKNFGGILGEAVIIDELDDKFLASEVKLKMGEFCGDEEEVLFVTGKSAEKIPLYMLDAMKGYDENCLVVYYNRDFLHKSRFTFTDLLDIVTALRAPNGCPWDRAQTHETIRMNTIEEAYEVAEAIDLKSTDKLIEETGDLLLQTALHAEIGSGGGEYDISDVLTGICDKLIKRHTHVFGNDHAANSADALKTWENNKEKLKHQDSASQAIDEIAKSLPAVMYAEKVAKKAAKANFDFSSSDEIFDKTLEELNELKESVNGNGDVFEEAGDLLFAAANLARYLKVDGELALIRSTQKFAERFKLVESAVVKDGYNMKDLSEEKLNEYYLKAKEQLKNINK